MLTTLCAAGDRLPHVLLWQRRGLWRRQWWQHGRGYLLKPDVFIAQRNRPAAFKHETGSESGFSRSWCVKHGHLKIQVDSAAAFSKFFYQSFLCFIRVCCGNCWTESFSILSLRHYVLKKFSTETVKCLCPVFRNEYVMKYVNMSKIRQWNVSFSSETLVIRDSVQWRNEASVIVFKRCSEKRFITVKLGCGKTRTDPPGTKV